MKKIKCKYCDNYFYPTSEANVLCFDCQSSRSRIKKYKKKNSTYCEICEKEKEIIKAYRMEYPMILEIRKCEHG